MRTPILALSVFLLAAGRITITDQQQVIQEGIEEAVDLSSAQVCREAFADVNSGFDPYLELTTAGYAVLITTPSDWNVVGLTYCWSMIIGLNGNNAPLLGKFGVARVLLHELAHIAVCEDHVSGKISDKKSEKIAQKIEKACAPTWDGVPIDHHHGVRP